MFKVLLQRIPASIPIFLDDLGIDGPPDRYDDEVLPGARRVVWEHVHFVRGVLSDVRWGKAASE
jgi:hypothetical protein